jgi:hypothetical protein
LLAAFQWMVMPSWTVSSRLAYGGYNFNVIWLNIFVDDC